MQIVCVVVCGVVRVCVGSVIIIYIWSQPVCDDGLGLDPFVILSNISRRLCVTNYVIINK